MRKPPPTHYILRAPSVCPLCHAEQKVGEDVTHFGACWPRCLVSVPSKSIKREHDPRCQSLSKDYALPCDCDDYDA